jgi:hypothetical protein
MHTVKIEKENEKEKFNEDFLMKRIKNKFKDMEL